MDCIYLAQDMGARLYLANTGTNLWVPCNEGCEFLDQLRKCRRLKEGCVPWSSVKSIKNSYNALMEYSYFLA